MPVTKVTLYLGCKVGWAPRVREAFMATSKPEPVQAVRYRRKEDGSESAEPCGHAHRSSIAVIRCARRMAKGWRHGDVWSRVIIESLTSDVPGPTVRTQGAGATTETT